MFSRVRIGNLNDYIFVKTIFCSSSSSNSKIFQTH